METTQQVFFENQALYGGTCRIHVINNALGKSILSRKRFYDYCDQFDMENHCGGSREFFFIHNNNNIISFILNQFHIQTSYFSSDELPTIDEETCDNIMAVMTFSDSHIWCYKKYNNVWYKLDSSSLKPQAISFRNVFSRQGCGWIILWNKSEPTHKKSSSTLLSKKKYSKIVSKRHHTEPITLPDISYPLEKDPSNE